MKKITYLLLAAFLFFAACDSSSDDDLKKENQQLKEALAGDAKIVNVDFENGQMILTYSNGVKVGTDIPDILQGEDGATPYIGDDGNWWIGDENTNVSATGKEGVGIKEITYDEETGILTILLTNDQESKFVISTSDAGDLSALIMSDLNGKYLVKRITMGDIPYVEVDYTEDNQIKKLTSYTADGYQTLKSFEFEKVYENGLPVKVVNRQFATERTTKYEDEHFEDNSVYYEFNENKGDWFIEENIDGAYYFYEWRYEQEGKHMYKRSFATKGSRLNNEIVNNNNDTYKVFKFVFDMNIVTDDTGSYETFYIYEIKEDCLLFDAEQQDSEIVIKANDNSFKFYYIYNNDEFLIDGEAVVKYYAPLAFIRTIKGSYEIGDLIDEKNTEIQYNLDNTIDKIYNSIQDGDEADSYFQHSYDGDKLAKVELYTKDGDQWIKDVAHLSFVYNSQGLLEETIEHDEEGAETVIAKIDYDQEGNPVEIFKYFGKITYEDYFSNNYYQQIDPNTGQHYDGDEVYMDAGLYSVAKLEYDYSMKNFFGNTLAGLFPELYDFNFNNAIKSATVSNSFVSGAIEYKDFNEGGYPEVLEFIGSAEGGAYVGQLKIEYKKIEE